MVPISNRALLRVAQLGQIGAHLETLFAAAAEDGDVDFALGPRRHRHLEVFPRADVGGAELA